MAMVYFPCRRQAKKPYRFCDKTFLFMWRAMTSATLPSACKKKALFRVPFFLARHRGFEPLAFGSVDRRSIQLR